MHNSWDVFFYISATVAHICVALLVVLFDEFIIGGWREINSFTTNKVNDVNINEIWNECLCGILTLGLASVIFILKIFCTKLISDMSGSALIDVRNPMMTLSILSASQTSDCRRNSVLICCCTAAVRASCYNKKMSSDYIILSSYCYSYKKSTK